MTDIQIKNLFIFYFLYNGCDSTCSLTNQSPDYLMEKWDKLIGIPGNQIRYPELIESELYQEWEKIWLRGKQNPIPENIMMFLIKTHHRENGGRYCRFIKVCNLFQTYVGKTYEIKKEEYNHIHPIFIDGIEKIIKRVVFKKDIREIILNNMLS